MSSSILVGFAKIPGRLVRHHSTRASNKSTTTFSRISQESDKAKKLKERAVARQGRPRPWAKEIVPTCPANPTQAKGITTSTISKRTPWRFNSSRAPAKSSAYSAHTHSTASKCRPPSYPQDKQISPLAPKISSMRQPKKKAPTTLSVRISQPVDTPARKQADRLQRLSIFRHAKAAFDQTVKPQINVIARKQTLPSRIPLRVVSLSHLGKLPNVRDIAEIAFDKQHYRLMRKIFHMKAAMTAAISSKPADFLEPEHSEELIYDNTVLIHQPSISPPQPSVMSQHKLTPTSHHRKALKKIIQRQFGSYSFEPFLVSDEVDARALSCNVLAASSAGAYIPDGKDPDQEDSSIWSDVAFNDSYISICSERGEYVPTTYKGVELPEDSITFGPSRFISSKSSFEAPRSLSGSTLQLDRSISSVLKSCFSSKPTNSKKSKISWADDLGRPLCSIREYNFTQDDRNQRGGDLTALFGHLVEWSTADDPKPHYRWTSDDPTGFFLYADETGGLAFSIQPKLLDRYSAVQRYYARESYFGVIPQGFYGEKDRVLWLFEAGRTPSIEDVYARLPDGRVVY